MPAGVSAVVLWVLAGVLLVGAIGAVVGWRAVAAAQREAVEVAWSGPPT